MRIQDMDMGVLFCTYSLLNQKSRSTKEITREMEKHPDIYGHKNILDVHDRMAAHEASRGKLEFGESRHALCHSQCACRHSPDPEHSVLAGQNLTMQMKHYDVL